MLISFCVGNLSSFGHYVLLSMDSKGLKGLETTNIINIEKNKKKLLKSAVIYGANASGKSNLIKAFKFMADFVINSGNENQMGHIQGIEPFLLSSKFEIYATHFEIVFVYEGIKYRYGFDLDKQKVYNEWLYYVPKKRETLLFKREHTALKLSKQFSEGIAWKKSTSHLGVKIKQGSLFVSILNQMFNGNEKTYSDKIIKWFNRLNIITNTNQERLLESTISLLKEGKYSQEINNFLINVDSSIKGFSYSKENYKLDASCIKINHKYNHSNQVKSLDLLRYESDGIKKIFALSGVLCDILENGKILIIDDFELNLHPILIKKIVELFHNNANKNNAQLIFTTHDTNLLSKELFRRDQIWFMEKDKVGESNLFSLAEFNANGHGGVREYTSYGKNYLNCQYGGVANWCLNGKDCF